MEVPAFYYLEYDENVSGDFVNERNPCWKIRFAPSQLGDYSINPITIIDQSGTYIIDPNLSFTCIESSEKGIIRVGNQDSSFLKYANNESYFPIGRNVCWWNEEGTSQWENTFT